METLAGLSQLTQMSVLSELVMASDKGIHCLTLDDLAERIAHPRKVIVKRMQALMGNGFAKSVRVACYAPTPKGHKRHSEGGEIKGGIRKGSKAKPRAVLSDSLRARLWRAIRTLQKGTLGDILQVAARPEETKALLTAQRLASELCRAGYLKKLPRRSKPSRDCSNGEVVYYLTNNTGPIVPKLRVDKGTGERGLFDRNTNEFTPFSINQPRPKAARRAS